MHEIAISEADTIIVDPIHFEKKKNYIVYLEGT